jgi:hypothetical protein
MVPLLESHLPTAGLPYYYYFDNIRYSKKVFSGTLGTGFSKEKKWDIIQN